MADDPIAELFIRITTDMKKFDEGISKAQGGMSELGLNLDKFTEKGKELFNKFGIDVDKFAGKFGVSSPMLLGIAAAGVAIFEIGKQVFAVGKEFDEAFAKIGKSTGAVGEDLTALKDTFTGALSRGINQSINEVAEGFQQLSIKLDITGKQLEDYTVLFANFADSAQTTMGKAVTSVTDIVNKWGLSLETVPDLLDQLLRASQLGGISVENLSGIVKTASAQFQAMGFSLTESLALFAAFNKAGVNTESVVRALNTAIVKFQQDGKDVATGIRELFTEIKNADDPTKALSLSIEAFGSKAGIEMSRALRNGKVSIDEMVESIANARGTLDATSEATETFDDKIGAATNKIKAYVEPLGEVLVGLGKDIVDFIVKGIEAINGVLAPALEFIQGAFRTFKAVASEVFGFFAAIIKGDWATAWTQAQLIVLNAVKFILDAISTMINTGIGLINNFTAGIRDALKNVGVEIGAFGKISLSQVTGLEDQIKRLNESLKENSKETSKVIIKSSEQAASATQKQSDAAKAVIGWHRELVESYGNVGGSLAAFDEASNKAAEDERKRTEKEIKQVDQRKDAWGQFFDKVTEQSQNWNGVIQTALNSVSVGFQTALSAMGEAIAHQQNAWDALAKGALKALAAIVRGIGDQLAAMAAADTIKAIAALVSIVGAGAAPGFFAAAAVEAGGAVAAYAAAAALSAYQGGTKSAIGGAALVGEQGPEIVNIPRGAEVVPASRTGQMLRSGGDIGGGHTFVFNSPVTKNPVQERRMIKQTMEELAFSGVLL